MSNEQKAEDRQLPLHVPIPATAMDQHVSKHLTIFECRDKYENRTPILGISGRTADCFEYIRDQLGIGALEIYSGFRTPETNERVGGAKDSMHMHGRALDIALPRHLVPQAARLAEEFFGNHGGIGLYPTFLHIDDRHTKARWDMRGGERDEGKKEIPSVGGDNPDKRGSTVRKKKGR